MTESNGAPGGYRAAKLGKRGAWLWDQVTGTYSLRPDDTMLLEDACHTLDLIDKIEAQLVGAELLLVGAYDQPIANPLIDQVKAHRSVMARLLGQLKLPNVAGVQAELDRTDRARNAANARWGRGGATS